MTSDERRAALTRGPTQWALQIPNPATLWRLFRIRRLMASYGRRSVLGAAHPGMRSVEALTLFDALISILSSSGPTMHTTPPALSSTHRPYHQRPCP